MYQKDRPWARTEFNRRCHQTVKLFETPLAGTESEWDDLRSPPPTASLVADA